MARLLLVSFALVALLNACSANLQQNQQSCTTCQNTGTDIQYWFQQLGELSNKIGRNCINLPQADKVSQLEKELDVLQRESSANATKFEKFKIDVEKRLQLLDEKIEKKLAEKSKRIENGVIEREGDNCMLKCKDGAYAVPKQPFPCDSNTMYKCAVAESCKDILKYHPNSASGQYKILAPTGSLAYDVFCDMSTDKGGWTLAAVIANGDSNLWTFGDGDKDFGDMNSLWENDVTLESSANLTYVSQAAEDFKSKAFLNSRGHELLVTFKGKRYIQSGKQCLGGKSLKELFNVLRFSCAGSSYNCQHGKCLGPGATSTSTLCYHICSVAQFYPILGSAGEPLANGKPPNGILLKTGEGEKAQDGNKDRVYISTYPFRDNVDYVPGLGSFTSLSGKKSSADIGVRDDVSKESTDRSLFYGLFVR